MAKLSKDVLLAAVLAVHLEVGAVDGVEAGEQFFEVERVPEVVDRNLGLDFAAAVALAQVEAQEVLGANHPGLEVPQDAAPVVVALGLAFETRAEK